MNRFLFDRTLACLDGNSHAFTFRLSDMYASVHVFLFSWAYNYRATTGSIWPYNIAGLISEIYEKSSLSNRQKLSSSTTPLSFDAPAKRNPHEYAIQLISPETRLIVYICVADSVGLTSFKFVQAPKDASFLQQSAFWPFKAIQASKFDDFGTNQSKARMRLPISLSLWLSSYLASFLRYVDLLAKNYPFCYPFLIRRPHSLYVPFGISRRS